ncbi:MAG: SH3 domain-containing protein [Chloroflexi bacterium]|nr:SH3 domain-containing protein [Chloroflexota bacterium]
MFKIRYVSAVLLVLIALAPLSALAQDDDNLPPVPPGRIAVGDDSGLFTIRADGSDQLYLAEDGSEDCWLRDGAWSPDGGLMLYTSICGGGTANNWRPQPDEGPRTARIFIYDFASQSSRELIANNGDYQDYAGTWHPDGERYVIYSNRENDTYNLYLVNYITEETTPLTAFNDNVGHVAFDPTGRFLLYNRYVPQTDGLRWEVHALDIESGTLPATDDMFVTAGFTPNWSPDGQWIAFADDQDIFVMPADCILNKTSCAPEADAINVTQTPEIEEREPFFSPDQTQIAYLADTNLDPVLRTWDLYRQELRTGLRQRLTETANVSERSSGWQPEDVERASIPDNVPVFGRVNANDQVNFRSSPSTASDANRIGTLAPNTQLIVQGVARLTDRDWYQVTLAEDGTVGWIAASLVALEGDEARIPDITAEVPQ